MEQNYLSILTESLEKKSKVLDEISKENLCQKEILKADEMDMEAFEASVNRKAALIDKVALLDEGFESMYEHVRESLSEEKQRYREEIIRLKALIGEITDKTVAIQKEEWENRNLAEAQFSKEKQKVRQVKNSKQVAHQYYKNMRNLNYVDSQFLDKKK